jgi:hypothetical protein
MALHLHTTGGYSTGGKSVGRVLRGVYMAPIGTTVREDSILVVGHVFQEKLMPSSSSWRVGSKASLAPGGGGCAAMACFFGKNFYLMALRFCISFFQRAYTGHFGMSCNE